MNDSSTRIGLIGAGTMGAPIARRLLEAGHALTVFDASADAVAALVTAGARAVSGVADMAAGCDVILLSLPGPRDVEAVIAGADGLLERARDGQVIVDLSTNAHDTVLRLATLARERGVALLDAPLSGGKAAALKGQLTMMVGGDATVLERVRPLLALFASTIFHVGDTGMGTIAKLVNNQIFLTAAVTIQEGVVLAAKAGLATDALMDVLGKASAASYLGLAPLLLSRKFDTPFFRLDLAAKDLTLALQSAESLGVDLPTTRAALDLYRESVAEGRGAKVFHATLEALEAHAGTQIAPLRRE